MVKAVVVLVVLLLQSPRLSGVTAALTATGRSLRRRVSRSRHRGGVRGRLRHLRELQFPNFVSTRVVANLLTDNAFLGVVAAGMTFVIISGGIDLSVGSVIGFATVFLALTTERLGTAAVGRVRDPASALRWCSAPRWGP